MSNRKHSTIRFAVGDREDVRSCIWRLWATGDGLYLAARSHAGITKFSFHKSGKFRYAINESAGGRKGGADRALYKWERSSELVPGWTRCFGITVPPRITRQPFGHTFNENKPVHFEAAPSEGEKVLFPIVFSSRSTRPEDAMRDLGPGIEIIGRIELRRESAWLFCLRERLSIDERRVFESHFEKLKIHMSPGATGDEVKHAFLHVIQKEPVPALADIELGRENLALSDGNFSSQRELPSPAS